MSWYLYTLILIGATTFVTSPIWVFAALRWYSRHNENNRKGQGMAKKRETWDIEYGIKPNPERYSGYDKTVTERLIASSHDEAVALLKEYDPDFNPLHIVSSKRGGLTYIVPEKNASIAEVRGCACLEKQK
jgi:hypothetical protein